MAVLSSTGILDPDDRLHEAVASFELAYEGGDNPDSREWLARYPEVADRLAEYFAERERLSRMVASESDALPEELPRIPGYEILSVIGVGGMGIVYKARQIHAQRIVALKVIRPERLEGLSAEQRRRLIERFITEAQAASRLEHEHIVRVYHVGEAGGRPFSAMQYVEGTSLYDLVRQNGPLEPRRAAGYLAKIAGAIHEAHHHGILHRDLKPQNILLDLQTDRPLVAHFGLAKLMESGTGPTRTTDVMGTAPYMPPEQARSSAGVTVASDVYSLGATLYELLTGRPPFRGHNDVETLLQVINQEVARPRSINPAIDRDLEIICLACLKKEPKDRYPTAVALAEDLENWLAGRTINQRPTGNAERFVRWCRRNPWIAGLGAAALMFLIAGSIASTAFAFRAQANADESGRNAKKAQDNEITALARLAERDRALVLADEREKLAGRRYYAARINLAQREWRQDRAVAMLNVLDELRPRAGESDWRNFEWHYLRRLSCGERLTLSTVPKGAPEKPAYADYSNWVNAVTYSSDGRYLAASMRADVIVSDAPSGKELQRLHPPSGGSFYGIAFRPGRKQLAMAWVGDWDPNKMKFDLTNPDKTPFRPSHLTVREWETGREVLRIPGTFGIAYDREGTRLAASVGGAMKVFDAETGAEVMSLEDKEYPRPGGCAFSPDGKQLTVWTSVWVGPYVNSYRSVVRAWDLETAKLVRTLEGHTEPITDVAWSADGRRLASGARDESVRVWDASTGVCIHILRANMGVVAGIAFGPDDRTLISASSRNNVAEDRGVAIVWDLNTGQQRHVLRGHAGIVNCVAARPGSTEVATGSQDRTVKVWDLAATEESRSVAETRWSSGRVAFSVDCRLAVRATYQSGEENIEILEMPSGRLLRKIAARSNQRRLALSPNGRWVATTWFDDRDRRSEKEVTIWEVATGQKLATLPLFAAPVWGLAFSPDGSRLVTGSEDHVLRIWDVQTAVEVQQLRSPEERILAFAPDGRVLVTAGKDRTIRIWDVETGTHREIPIAPDLPSLQGHVSSLLMKMVFSVDGRRLAVVEIPQFRPD
jgi:WD40 repeat protein/tRNA A-37 threonylcarbamoyl transferase component Bud32